LPPLSTFTGAGVIRDTGWDYGPFPPSRLADGPARYHAKGDPWPMYCALSEAAARAEARVRSGPIDERRCKHVLSIIDLVVIDLREPDTVAYLEIDLRDLVREQDSARPLASRAIALGAEGMVVPCAPEDGEWNLVIFSTGFWTVTQTSEEGWQPKLPP
jgi:RES domain-containing protein